MTTHSLYHPFNVSVYVEGASHPVCVNPCRTQAEAETLKARIEQQIKDRGWSQKVRIEA